MQNSGMLLDFLTGSQAQNYIHDNADKNPINLALNVMPFAKQYRSFVIDQIAGRQKLRQKLPFWVQNQNIIFPPTLSVQQCSSQATAFYKAKLWAADNPNINTQTFADLSAGFGVDAFAISKTNLTQNPDSIFHLIEPNNWLSTILEHNMNVLGSKNMRIHNYKAEVFAESEFMNNCTSIFADPDRRSVTGQKLYLPEDFSPNIIPIFKKFLKHNTRTLIKISPMADIRQMLNILVHVKKIAAVGGGQECKELLFLSDSETELPIGKIPICMALPDQNGVSKINFETSLDNEKQSDSKISDLQQYIFLPHAAALKTGGFKSLAVHYHVWALHPHTHVYTSDTFVENWPGRCFKVLHLWPYKPELIRDELKGRKPIFFMRNFPDVLSVLQKKLHLNPQKLDNEPVVGFALTLKNGKPAIILAEEISGISSDLPLKNNL